MRHARRWKLSQNLAVGQLACGEALLVRRSFSEGGWLPALLPQTANIPPAVFDVGQKLFRELQEAL
jgi:hypothetical protein